MIRLIIIISITVLMAACGPKISGTGQHGEAAIAGVVLDVDGNQAIDKTVKVARSDYRARGGETYGSYSIDSTVTDNNGFFRIIVPINGTYTISLKTDSSFLLLQNQMVKSVDVNLGEISLSTPTTLLVYPWWDTTSVSQEFIVKGTDWQYTVNSKTPTEIEVFAGDITLIHKGTLESENVNTIEDNYIGDSAKYIDSYDSITDSTIDSTAKVVSQYNVPNSGKLNESINISFVEDSNDVRYTVDWGDNALMLDTIKTDYNGATHIYKKTGKYTITIKKLSRNSKVPEIWDTIKEDEFIININ